MPASDLYLRVRDQEGRLYSDEVVAQLPDVPADHPLRREWKARAASLSRLLNYMARRRPLARVLELGCGNGWLSHHLSELSGVQVWGLDRLSVELIQAARIFGGSRLVFLTADIFRPPFAETSFDFIVLASTIQYFPELAELLRTLRTILAPGGELHIIDSPLYQEANLPAAQERTRAYYTALGVPEMAAHYFHHTFGELKEFSPRWLYRPDSLQVHLSRFLGRIDSPFPWLAIGSH